MPDGLPPRWLAALSPAIALARDTPPLPAAELDRMAGVVTGCAVAIAETGTIILDHVLRMSVPSLAEALKAGLISVLAPPADVTSAQISLGYGPAVLSAIAGGENGDQVAAPHLRPAEVRRLDITDLTVGGLSGLRLAG